MDVVRGLDSVCGKRVVEGLARAEQAEERGWEAAKGMVLVLDGVEPAAFVHVLVPVARPHAVACLWGGMGGFGSVTQ